MPCQKENHTHVWPLAGPLTIERCEHYCMYCTGENRRHNWKFAWFLRRHVEAVHIKGGDFADVQLAAGWTRAKGGNAKGTPKKKAPARRARKNAESPEATPSPPSTHRNVDLTANAALYPTSSAESMHVATDNNFFSNNPADGSSPFNDSPCPFADGSSPHSSWISDVPPRPEFDFNGEGNFGVTSPAYAVPNNSPLQASNTSYDDFQNGLINLQGQFAVDPQGSFAPFPIEDAYTSSLSSHTSLDYNEFALADTDFMNMNLQGDHTLPLVNPATVDMLP
ncbi:hypothetical protein LTR08_004302 [Meristemomyces frigidus]|nr:hypothetical protein LTR08_004302 [Meristemomyces frigidus]